MGKFQFDQDDFVVEPKKREKPEKETVVSKKSVTGSTPSGMTGTRGRKGMALPTMNMRFSKENYEYIKREGAVRGLSATAFVNWLIETYRSVPEHVNYTDDFRKTEDW